MLTKHNYTSDNFIQITPKTIFQKQSNFRKDSMKIKKLISEQTSNIIPDGPFYAMCDAFNFRIGAAFLQSLQGIQKGYNTTTTNGIKFQETRRNSLFLRYLRTSL